MPCCNSGRKAACATSKSRRRPLPARNWRRSTMSSTSIAPCATARHLDRTGGTRLGAHDPRVSAVVEEVDAYRLDCTRKLFLALGLTDDEAHARSILVFAYVFGHSLMAYDRNNPKVTEFKRWIAERITGR